MDPEQQPQNPPADPENAKNKEEEKVEENIEGKDDDVGDVEDIDQDAEITIEEIFEDLEEKYKDPIENYEKVFHPAFIDQEEQKRIDEKEENKEPGEAEAFATELGIEEDVEKKIQKKKLYYKRDFMNDNIVIIRGEDQDYSELNLMTTAAEFRDFIILSIGVHEDMDKAAGGDGSDLRDLQDEIIKQYKDYKDFIERIKKVKPEVGLDAPEDEEDKNAKEDGQEVITFEDISKQDGQFFQEHKKSMKETEDSFCKTLCKIASKNKEQLKGAFKKKQDCEDKDTQNYLKIQAALTCTCDKHPDLYNELIENPVVKQEDIARINYKQTLRDQTLTEAEAVNGKTEEFKEELKRKEQDYEEKKNILDTIKENVVQTVHSLKNKTSQIVRVLEPGYKYDPQADKLPMSLKDFMENEVIKNDREFQNLYGKKLSIDTYRQLIEKLGLDESDERGLVHFYSKYRSFHEEEEDKKPEGKSDRFILKIGGNSVEWIQLLYMISQAPSCSKHVEIEGFKAIKIGLMEENALNHDPKFLIGNFQKEVIDIIRGAEGKKGKVKKCRD